MITLSKLDNSPILVSLESIKYIESTPDSLILFINGDSIFVREPLEVIEQRVVEYKSKVLKKSSQD